MPKEIIAVEGIEQKIFLIRGKKVMLDIHLAELYGVKTRRLNEQVRRNIKRFPADFMFRLTWEEAQVSRSQFATLKRGQNIKHLPHAFTEQGMAMLSSVLHSERAIRVNIAIMRAFVRLRQILAAHKELADRLAELEHRMYKKDREIIALFEAIRRLMNPPEKKKEPIGFRPR